MALVRLQNISLGFGGPALLDHVDLSIESGERICLVGRNGAGKSTLMKVLAREIVPDDGVLQYQSMLRVARLGQEVPEGLGGTIFDIVAGGLGEMSELLKQYHAISRTLGEGGDEPLLRRLEEVQHRLEATGGWQFNQRVETVLSRLELPPDADFDALSGGLKRRALLGRALACEPDLLLLDEPTNHLDIDAIAWLEDFLLSFQGALLFITHDRMFLQRLATRILELDRGSITSWPGDYENYLRRREERLNAESMEQSRFDKRLADEEVWIRQGIKARRTRNEGRVRALEQMRRERFERRQSGGNARFSLHEAERSGSLVAEVEDVTYSYGTEPVIRDFSTTILRGDKVGIIGPNGAGKSTLLGLLLGRLQPQSGKVKLGTGLEIAYFDQHRAALDTQKSVVENLELGSDTVEINGKRRHVVSYLGDFLFSPERLRSPVSSLSGGERNRLLLARLFTRPANLLVMDEPTNDLDVETLELLEGMLVDFRGTLLLVSHDRAFLNNVVTSTLAFEGKGSVREYVGGYDDWLQQRRPIIATLPSKKIDMAEVSAKPQQRPKKLSYKEQRELEMLPQLIEQLESEQQRLHAAMGDSAFYQKDSAEIAAATARVGALEEELASAYARWESLEALQER